MMKQMGVVDASENTIIVFKVDHHYHLLFDHIMAPRQSQRLAIMAQRFRVTS